MAVTTHNGVARSFGSSLANALEEADCQAMVFMGGVLNEDVDDSPTPIDVREDLWKRGIHTPEDFPALVEQLRSAPSA